MMKLPTLNRFHAFGWHILISLGVASLSATLVFVLWYPGLLARASGVRDIFLLLLLVDVVLGPVITLIIFNPKKKELRRDLMVVGAIQLMAILYGLHTVCEARPAYIVFNVDRFDVVYANDITPENLAKVSKVEYQSLPLLGPKLVAARSPDDAKAHKDLLFQSLAGGADLPQMPQYYQPYSTLKGAVIKHIQPLDMLKQYNQHNISAVDALMHKYAAAKTGVGYLPLKGKTENLTVIVNRETSKVLEMVALVPWE